MLPKRVAEIPLGELGVPANTDNLRVARLRRTWKLLVGMFLVLCPVLLYLPIRVMEELARNKQWLDGIEGTGYLLVAVCLLWGLYELLSCMTKIDLITLVAILASVWGLLMVVWEVKGVAYLIKYW